MKKKNIFREAIKSLQEAEKLPIENGNILFKYKEEINPHPNKIEEYVEEFKKWLPGNSNSDVNEELTDFLRTSLASYGSFIEGETVKAFGGCKKCYGKGYSTTKVQAGHRYSFWELNPINPCSCDRGKQIKALLEKDNTTKQ